MSLKTKKLGLAAYIKMKGTELLGIADGGFHFETDRPEAEWETEYMNTDSYRHDAELMALRRLLRESYPVRG